MVLQVLPSWVGSVSKQMTFSTWSIPQNLRDGPILGVTLTRIEVGGCVNAITAADHIYGVATAQHRSPQCGSPHHVSPRGGWQAG